MKRQPEPTRKAMHKLFRFYFTSQIIAPRDVFCRENNERHLFVVGKTQAGELVICTATDWRRNNIPYDLMWSSVSWEIRYLSFYGAGEIFWPVGREPQVYRWSAIRGWEEREYLYETPLPHREQIEVLLDSLPTQY